MAEAAKQMEINGFANNKSFAQAEPIRFENLRRAAEMPKSRSGFAAMILFAVMVILAGFLGSVAKGAAAPFESYTGSAEALVGVLFVAEGAAAVICFVLAVRWLRS